MIEKEKSILEFIYDRMVHTHGENSNFDYMAMFKKAIEEHASQKEIKFPSDAEIENLAEANANTDSQERASRNAMYSLITKIKQLNK